MNNFRDLIDILFYLRGFLAFCLVPFILLFNIYPFYNILLHSNVYLNNYRFPNLAEPLYFCCLYFFSTILFITIINIVLKKINFKNNFQVFDNVNNINIFLIFFFLILLLFKFRVIFNLGYFEDKNYLGDLLIDNIYTNVLIHFFLPNELTFIILSFYFYKTIKNKFINIFFVSYIGLSVASTLLFGSRFLLMISAIMIIFLIFKLVKKSMYLNILIMSVISIFMIYTFIPFKLFSVYMTGIFDSLIVTIDHLIWRLDSYHLVDLGYSAGNLDITDHNSYGRDYGIITLGDTGTGIGFPLFYNYIEINHSILKNTLIVVVSAFCMSIFHSVLKLISYSFGTFFFIAFLFKFCVHWDALGVDQIITYFFKLSFLTLLLALYIFFEKKFILSNKTNNNKL